MLTAAVCNKIITICAETQMKLADSLENENNQKKIDNTKKQIELINEIIQKIINYIASFE